MSRLVHQRITTSFIFLLLLLLGVVFFLISIDLIGLAFLKLGFPPKYSVLLLFLSLIGSYINIPIKEIISREPGISGRIINFYWFRYIIPPLEVEHRTIIAVNLGGGVIPVGERTRDSCSCFTSPYRSCRPGFIDLPSKCARDSVYLRHAWQPYWR